METKNFLIILLSAVLIFSVIASISSIITGYVTYGDIDSVFPNNTSLVIIIIFSIVILISIIVLKKKRIK